MMAQNTWSTRFEDELKRAKSARAGGNEGMARVCARRAAGILAEEYLLRTGRHPAKTSAYDRLRYLQQLPELPTGVYSAVEQLLLRVNSEHQLPVDADLINVTEWLRTALISD